MRMRLLGSLLVIIEGLELRTFPTHSSPRVKTEGGGWHVGNSCSWSGSHRVGCFPGLAKTVLIVIVIGGGWVCWLCAKR